MATTPHQRARICERRLTELHTPAEHHIVTHSGSNFHRDSEVARAHGANLVTGDKHQLVAHFHDRAKAEHYHRALWTAGAHEAKLRTVRAAAAAKA